MASGLVSVATSSSEPNNEDETANGHPHPKRENLLSTGFALPAGVDQHAAGQRDDQSHERPEQPPRALPGHGQQPKRQIGSTKQGAGRTAQPRKHVPDKEIGDRKSVRGPAINYC
jgi:hypothetical protein